MLKTDNNNTLCCLKHDDDLQSLVLALEEENRNNRHSRQGTDKLRWWTERNHAAHLYASDHSAGSGLSWNHRESRTSLLRNLTLSDDGRQLAVHTMRGAGSYFVYALYTFDFSNATWDRKSPIGVHNIYRHRPTIINAEKQRLWTAKFRGEKNDEKTDEFPLWNR
ncbi:uncharacterized protein LOC117342353 [Pecten maximus]|uniref:uncharacterized protein LOC117342353 n=1 Tax=Pecten maximus TaxID=6579 RepID=UPI001458E1E6|nr:uncharacterized protein LOC117342353 [Pecten maximus]